MVKFCLQCKNAFWGGQFCPKCDGQVELRDLPAGRWRVDYGAPGCADGL